MSGKIINCIIIDDELASHSVLEQFISRVDILHLAKSCFNAEEAFNYLQLHQEINLIFLDINMPNQSGLDFYKSLIHPPEVIFTTAYPQYAIDGFEVDAVDYLLKPIAYNRFLSAVQKMIKTKIEPIQDSNFILINQNKTLHKVYFEDINYIEAYGDYVKIHANNTTLVTHSTLKDFLIKLPQYFEKCHKSFAVNCIKIEKITGNTIFISDYNIPIGMTFKQKLIDKLQE